MGLKTLREPWELRGLTAILEYVYDAVIINRNHLNETEIAEPNCSYLPMPESTLLLLLLLRLL